MMPQRLSVKDLFNIERLEAARPQTLFEVLKDQESDMEERSGDNRMRKLRKVQEATREIMKTSPFSQFRMGMDIRKEMLEVQENSRKNEQRQRGGRDPTNINLLGNNHSLLGTRR